LRVEMLAAPRSPATAYRRRRGIGMICAQSRSEHRADAGVFVHERQVASKSHPANWGRDVEVKNDPRASPLQCAPSSCGITVTSPLELPFTPGGAEEFIELLWRHLPAYPDGALVGAMYLAGDHGQIVVNLRGPQVGHIVVLPGQVMRVADPMDPATWSVIDGPATMHLRRLQ